jgi:hypothetical protein
MNSIKHTELDLRYLTKPKPNKKFRTSFSLLLIFLVFSMAPTYSFFSFIKPAMGAGLASVSVVPASNTINEKSTYDISLKTATSGAIKTIQIDFPSTFDLDSATRYIERTGIGSGSLSVTGTSLKYTVSSPVSVSAGTIIRLEIARIVATEAGSFTVNVKTLNAADSPIDGPTTSGSFTIKSITGDDVSPSFMTRKTLYDDDAGHAHGWNPNGNTKSFAIFDSDISGASDNEFISVMIRYANLAYCTASPGDTGLFVVHCDSAPVDTAVLDYVITKLPANVVTSTDTSTFKTSSLASFTSSQDSASFAKHDDMASEFP